MPTLTPSHRIVESDKIMREYLSQVAWRSRAFAFDKQVDMNLIINNFRIAV